MTEEEARGRWCPFANSRFPRVWKGYVEAGDALVVTKHKMSFAELSSCIASSCMAWRSSGGLSGDGYCGLAGKP